MLLSIRLFLAVLLLAIPQTAVADVKVTRNIDYGSEKRQRLDVYQPESCMGRCPVVIWVHGGGWRNGTKTQRSTTSMLRTWAGQGIVMVSIDYRLTPDVVHPAHIQDVAAATGWVSRNIQTYGGSPRRIFLMGHSAGAHLVALAGTSPIYLAQQGLDPAQLAGVFPIDTASHDLTQVNPFVRNMVRDAFGTDRAILREASPLYNVHAGRRYPPFIMAAVSNRPDAIATNKSLADKLSAVGGTAQVLVMQYPDSKRQLQAHAEIARDLGNIKSVMTQTLLEHVQRH